MQEHNVILFNETSHPIASLFDCLTALVRVSVHGCTPQIECGRNSCHFRAFAITSLVDVPLSSMENTFRTESNLSVSLHILGYFL
jgi:hypothetical protein